jgi:hypothetical protein
MKHPESPGPIRKNLTSFAKTGAAVVFGAAALSASAFYYQFYKADQIHAKGTKEQEKLEASQVPGDVKNAINQRVVECTVSHDQCKSAMMGILNEADGALETAKVAINLPDALLVCEEIRSRCLNTVERDLLWKK